MLIANYQTVSDTNSASDELFNIVLGNRWVL